MNSSQNKRKIILDTNVMYYLCDLSSPPNNIDIAKTALYIKENYQKCDFAISSVSFYEFIMHYRTRARYIRRVSTVMRNYHIRIYQDPYIPIPTKIIRPYDFTNIRQQNIKKLIGTFMPQKIDVESRFAAAILLIVLISDIAFEAFPDGDFNQKTISLLSNVANVSQKIVVDCLNESYKIAYTQNDPEGFIQTAFQNLLALLLPPSVSLCKKLSYMKEDDDVTCCFHLVTQEEWHKENEIIEKKISTRRTPTGFVSKNARRYGKSIGDKQLTAFLSEMWHTIGNTKGLESEPIKEYIFEITRSILLNGSAFRKNDINDSMILGSMSPEDCLITCDKKMIEHMEKYKEGHREYANSLLLLQELQ